MTRRQIKVKCFFLDDKDKEVLMKFDRVPCAGEFVMFVPTGDAAYRVKTVNWGYSIIKSRMIPHILLQPFETLKQKP